MKQKARLARQDWLLLLGLLLLTWLPALKYDLTAHPAEDAMMLMRYSKHLAEGHGIVWNVGDKPVDGATDFLFMVLLAALAKAGLALEGAARLVCGVSHALTALVVYVAVRRLHNAPRWAAFLSGAYLAVGPGMAYTAACFGAPFFALFTCITWYLAVKITHERPRHSTAFFFALSALLTSLIRPEGVILTGLMLLAVLYMRGIPASGKVAAYYFGMFLLGGGAYFVWRWSYFGYPLPNPYYVKGAGQLHWLSLAKSIAYTTILSLGFIWAFPLGFRSAKTARSAAFALIPVVGFTLAWVMLSDAMNFLMRFQYPTLPIVLISWYPLVRNLPRDWHLPRVSRMDLRSRGILALLAIGMAFGVLIVQQIGYGYLRRTHDGKYDAALALRDFRTQRYVMATTEAGLLPYYSGWRAVDAWGLNDQWIAHNGGVTEAYLARHKPHLIIFHAGFSPIVPPKIQEGDRWSAMVMTLKRYAEKNGYILAASYGEVPHQTHYYYVRRDFRNSAEIVRRIREMDYRWYLSGAKCFNYANPDLVGIYK